MSDAWNYLLFNNPLSSTVINSTKKGLSLFLKPKADELKNQTSKVSTKVAQELIPLYRQCGHSIWFLRLAGISGSAAVILGAYGAHRKFPEAKDSNRDLKAIFETANRYHFYHTFALLALPLSRRPLLTGSMMVTGTLLFCGTCYYAALADDQKYNRLAPIGGMTLIFAWLTLLL